MDLPLLFILYNISYLLLHITINCKTDLYPDDSIIHLAGRDIEILPNIQQDLNEIEKWCENNMFLNINKIKCMVIGIRKNILCNLLILFFY